MPILTTAAAFFARNWRPTLLLLLAATIAGSLYGLGVSRGKASVQAKWDAEKVESERLARQTQNRQAEIVAATEASASAAIAKEKLRHDRIIAAARAEARASALDRLRLSAELVRLYNDAASPESAPATAEPGDGPGTSGPTCADIAERAVENAAIANRNADQVERLQQFYNKQREALTR
jgi:hypothetical protein